MAVDVAGERAHQVVIVGAGFAGIAAARELAGSDVAVTLVDANNFHTFQPLLYQVATAGLDPADVAFPVRAVFPTAENVTFRHARVTACDLEHHAVTLDDGASLPFDELIVATGAVATFFAIEGAAEYTLPLYELRDARLLRNAILSTLEAVDAHPERYDGGAPTFVVIGGGPTGVEIAGAIAELLDMAVEKDRLRLDRERTKVVLVDAADRLLGAFGGRSSAYARRTLERRRVEVRLGASVAAVDAGSVALADGTHLRADVVVWAAGVTVTGTLVDSLLATPGRGGRAVVDGSCMLVGHPGVYVVGDAAAVPLGPGRDDPAPQLAQVAIQSGRYVAQKILAERAGGEAKPFVYRDKGIMATIGRRAAVAELAGPWPIGGRMIGGTLGWLAWLGLHLIYLMGGRNRVVVFLNWCWRYIGWTAGPRIIVEDTPAER